MLRTALTVGITLLIANAGLADCGPEPGPCLIEGGEYHIALPNQPLGTPPPTLMFLHGAGSSGEGTLRNTGLVKAVTDRGYALIAPSGTTRPGRNGRGWSFHPLRQQIRDEPAFLEAVRDDAMSRFGLDAQNMYLGGFSIGGSMTAYLACDHPDMFAAYLPVGGNFWRPHPETCAGPVRMLHTHGWQDGTVPLEGRIFRREADGTPVFAQGDVFEALEIWRNANACINYTADVKRIEDPYWIRRWETCVAGSRLEFALFPGGHLVPRGWADMALGRIETWNNEDSLAQE